MHSTETQQASISILSIAPSRKPAALADASIEIETDAGAITINDARVLKNRADELWLALPTYAVPDGKGYQYFPVVTLSRELKQLVSNVTLRAYEEWAKENPVPPAAPAGGAR